MRGWRVRGWRGRRGRGCSVSVVIIVWVRMLIFFFFFLLWTHATEDNILTEARNLRNMTMAQTPLLGEENTPLHEGGTNFASATPRHQVAFTPNPLATPLHGTTDVSATPGSATPLRTPLRDNLSINPDGGAGDVGATPREQRLRAGSARRALQAGFLDLPKPENNFELLVPEDEDDEDDEAGGAMTEEDAAERDARDRRVREEEERREMARRSMAVRLGLPRPAKVDVRAVEEQLNSVDAEEEDKELQEARRMVNRELAQLLEHDSIAHPLPGTVHPGGTRSAYVLPADEDVEAAKGAIHDELADLVGFPSATSEQLREGLLKLAKAESVDEAGSWAAVRQRLAYDAGRRIWVEPGSLSGEEHVAGYAALLTESRELMARDASKAAKAEKKLGVTLGGYQARAQALAKRVAEAFAGLQGAQVDFESFGRLRINEEAVGPRRVTVLKEEVGRLERRERLLQERYAELDAERRESEARVAALEEKVMADAEALNEAHLAEMEGVE